MSRVVVIAPHPDDETLGCGGTLLKHVAAGDEVHWVIVTRMSEELGFSADQIRVRANEIARVADHYGFADVHELGLPTTQLDALPAADVTALLAECFAEQQPEIVYVNNREDAHTDHRVVFDSVAANTKWFRHPSVKRVLAYETLSETDAALPVSGRAFNPTVFSDITLHIESKLAALAIYASEVGTPPFPRSPDAVRALAMVRGAASGYRAAEAFVLLRERG